MTDTTKALLTYNGVAIRERDEMLSLTDMWKAAGGDDARRPANWARKEGADFIAHMEAVLNVPPGHIIRTERGRTGSTFAHWQIGLAYAKYLNPEFHMWCNTVVRGHMQGKLKPAGGDVLALAAKAAEAMFAKVVAPIAEQQAEQNKTVAALTEQVAAQQARLNLLTADPTAHTSTEYRPMLSVVQDAGIPPKGRNAFVVRMSGRIRRWLGDADRMGETRQCKVTGRWLFHVNAIRDWQAAEGRRLMQERRDFIASGMKQSVMDFDKAKRRSKAKLHVVPPAAG